MSDVGPAVFCVLCGGAVLSNQQTQQVTTTDGREGLAHVSCMSLFKGQVEEREVAQTIQEPHHSSPAKTDLVHGIPVGVESISSTAQESSPGLLVKLMNSLSEAEALVDRILSEAEEKISAVVREEVEDAQQAIGLARREISQALSRKL